MPILRTQQDVASFYSVTPTAVRKWEAHPAFPKFPPYDTELIDQWRAIHTTRERKTTETPEADRIALGLKAVKLQMEQLKLEALKEERQRARGDILSRGELETSLHEIIVVARDQLMAISQKVARTVPKKQQSKVRTEVDRLVRQALDAMADMFIDMQSEDDDAD